MLNQQYAVYMADTGTARDIHHHLRYRVYCERKRYEQPVAAGVAEERDAEDTFSTHFIVRNRTANTWQGTARLIMSTRTRLPVQQMGVLYPHVERQLRDAPMAEVSRLAALRSACPCFRDDWRLLQATIAGLLDYSRLHEIEHWVFLVSPGLARILMRIGIPMETCGATVEHRGRRRPFRLSVTQAIRDVPWARENLSSSERFYNYFSESVFAHEEPWTDNVAFGALASVARAASVV